MIVYGEVDCVPDDSTPKDVAATATVMDARFPSRIALLNTAGVKILLSPDGRTSTDAGSTRQHYSWAPTSRQIPLVIVLEW